MKMIKFLAGLLLMLALFASVTSILYFPFKAAIFILPMWIWYKHSAFVILLLLSPFIGWILGYISKNISDWWENKIKEIDNKWKD